MLNLSIPDHVAPIRQKVLDFVEQEVYPVEDQLLDGHAGTWDKEIVSRLMQTAKDNGLWALGHPEEIGGGGMPFMDYVFVNEVIGRSEIAPLALGTHSLQDSIMLHRYASAEWRENYLTPLVSGEVFPSFGMTEPEVASSDPRQLQTRAELVGDEWVINGRKWFSTHAGEAAYTTAMVRTEDNDTPDHSAFSMILVPTDTPGYNIVRDVKVMGKHDAHYEVAYDDVRVPASNLLGPRGQGFKIAQDRLGPGRIFHCMRWLGQAQRAFDLMCQRANSRVAFGSALGEHQQIQKFIFDTATEIQSSRLLTLHAAQKIDQGDEARIEIGLIKVYGAKMLHNAIDRAIQVHGAMGVTEDTPLELMYRHARAARIYDGPDEVHVMNSARRILRTYSNGGTFDFGLR
ncbi:MAG: acyl-CoA dehydrogenase family protein [Hyphomonadaceae bacterium]|nr:acyl-CoA dehydrogenase family protein [Hyphomonadaceae bacterium]